MVSYPSFPNNSRSISALLCPQNVYYFFENITGKLSQILRQTKGLGKCIISAGVQPPQCTLRSAILNASAVAFIT